MITRRTMVAGGAAATTALGLGQAWSAEPAMTYAQAVAATWAPLDPAGGPRELARAATLAPNNHNVQPWTLQIAERGLTIRPDLARRLPIVDPDDHHLYVSLGCAAENVVQAAVTQGLRATPRFDAASGAVAIELETSTPTASDLAKAICLRQSSRNLYDGQPATADQLKRLAGAGIGEGVELMLLTDRAKIDGVRDYIIQGNTAEMADPAYVTELKSWLRFNESEALASRDGLFSATVGSPQLPSWLAPLVFNFFFTTAGENDKYVKQIASSAGIAVFVSMRNDKAQWVEVGRAVQRFCLTATALNMKTAFLDQPVEVGRVRSQLAAHLGVGDRRPDIVVRFGSGGAELPRSLRRPVAQVLA